MDIGFVIDVSSAVGRTNIRYIRLFVKDVIRRFSRRNTRFAIVIHSFKARRVLTLTRGVNIRNIDRMLLRIRYYGGRRYTGRALSYAKNYIFKGRPQCGRKRVLIVISSGVSVDRVWKPARGLVGLGVEIFAVITSQRAVREMQKITTTRNHVYVSSYSGLVAVANPIKKKICITPRGT